MRETVWHVAIILLVTGVVFFTNLGGAKLWDRDEPRNAGCAAEMMERGDWVVPMFNDELRHQKPVLLYWLMMSAYSVFGVNEFSARFWSAFLAIATTFATYGIARRLTNSTVAFYAAIALSTSLMFDVAARAATPDSLLIFCSTSALLFYVLGTFSRSTGGVELKNDGAWFPQNMFFIVAIYAMLGLGVLAKGPVAFLLPMAMMGLFMLIKTLPANWHERGDSVLAGLFHRLGSCLRPFHPIHFLRTLWSMRPILGAAIVLLIAAPWYWLVDARTEGDFTQLFFVGENIGRATRPMENHTGGLWFYPLAILIGFFPWSIFWGPVAVGLIKRHKLSGSIEQGPDSVHRVVTTLMLCWIGVQVGAFSFVQTKLPSYVTPCYPALAILTSVFLTQLSTQKVQISNRWSCAAMAGLVVSGLCIALGIGFATMNFMPNQFWLSGLGLIPLLGGVYLIWLLVKKQTQSIPVVFSVIALLFCVGLFGFGTVSLDAEQHSEDVLNHLRPSIPVATYGALESSWVVYAGRPIAELQVSEIAERDQDSRVGQARQKFWQPKPQPTVEAFLISNPDSMLITTDEHLVSIKTRLPEDYEVLQTADYFLKNKQIVLLGRRSNELHPGRDGSPSSVSAIDRPSNQAAIAPVDASRR